MIAPWFRLPVPDRPTRVRVVGAGIAGCAVAHQLAQLGIPVTLIDSADTVAAAASGNPTGIFKPFVTRDAGPIEQLHRAAYDFLLGELSRIDLTPDSLGRCGVLQLLERGYSDRQDLISLDREAASERAGVALRSGALWFEDAGWLRPGALCKAWLAHPLIDLAVGESQMPRASAREPVILAAGHALDRLPGCKALGLTSARGQITAFERDGMLSSLGCVLTGQRYAIPLGNTLYVGAGFQRDCDNTLTSTTDDDDNLAGLSHLLAAPPASLRTLYSRAAIRATTPDRLPLVGPLPDTAAWQRDYADLRHGRPPERYPDASVVANTWVLGGFGARGIVQAPWSAMLLAAWLAGRHEPGNDLQQWASVLHPGRFIVRRLQRDRGADTTA